MTIPIFPKYRDEFDGETPIKVKKTLKAQGKIVLDVIRMFQTPVAVKFLERSVNEHINIYELPKVIKYLIRQKELKQIGNTVFIPVKQILTPERRNEVMTRAKGVCEYPECYSRAIEVHHIVAQSKVNLKKYSASRIHSLTNLIAVCRDHHINYAWCKEMKRELIQRWDNEILQTIL